MPHRSRSRDGGDAQLRVFLRLAVATVGLVELARSLPPILDHLAGDHAALTSNHLAAWDLAFAVGLLVVAVQPYRVRGMLPMAAAITAVMALSLLLDALGGHVPEMAAGSHFLELCGLVLLWCLERVQYPTTHGVTLRLHARHRPAS